MIITIVAHGRRRRDTAALLAHLSVTTGQRSRVVSMANVTGRDAAEAMRTMERLRDGSAAEIAFHHLTINPVRRLSDGERDEAVRRIVAALGAADHPRVLWEHDGKARSGGDCDQHFHLVLGHVGPGLRALRVGFSYARLEAVARSLEVDWGEPLTDTRRHGAVAGRLRAMRRDDVADAVEARRPTDDPTRLPRSAMSSRTRGRAAAQGLDLPVLRHRIAAAYRSADTGDAARAALSEIKLSVVAADAIDTWLVTSGGAIVGALDRLVREPRASVAARMARASDEAQIAQTVPPRPEPPALARLHGQLDRLEQAARERLRRPRAAVSGAALLEPLLERRAAADAAWRSLVGEAEARIADALRLDRDIPTGLFARMTGASSQAERRRRAAADAAEAAKWAAGEASAVVRALDREIARARRTVAETERVARAAYEIEQRRSRVRLRIVDIVRRMLEREPALSDQPLEALLQRAFRIWDDQSRATGRAAQEAHGLEPPSAVARPAGSGGTGPPR